MSDPRGWLWVVLGLHGVGGLGLAIAYGNLLWSRTIALRGDVVRENYHKGG